ncbi:hypothetical protein ACFLQ2_05635, partial [archaeon]
LKTYDIGTGLASNLTVEGDYTNNGTSTWGDSFITLGTASYASTITNTGTINVDTAAVYGAASGFKYIATGSDWNWDSGPGTVNLKWGKTTTPSVTGGGGMTLEIDGDVILRGDSTISSGDKFKCVVPDTVILLQTGTWLQVYGALELTGTSGHPVVMDYPMGRLSSNVSINHVSMPVGWYGFQYYSVPPSNSIQDLTVSTTIGAMMMHTAGTISNISDSTFSGGSGSYWVNDVIVNNNAGAFIFDNCTFDTVTLKDSGGLVVSKNHAGTTDFVVYGVLASSETAPAGYRAADITNDFELKTATTYSTPFNSSYTLGANALNVQGLRVNTNTLFDTGASYNLTVASANVTAGGTLEIAVGSTFTCGGVPTAGPTTLTGPYTC